MFQFPGAHYSHPISHQHAGQAALMSGAAYPYHGAAYPHHGATYPHHGAPHPHHGAAHPHHGVPYPHDGAAYPHPGGLYAPPEATYPQQSSAAVVPKVQVSAKPTLADNPPRLGPSLSKELRKHQPPAEVQLQPAVLGDPLSQDQAGGLSQSWIQEKCKKLFLQCCYWNQSVGETSRNGNYYNKKCCFIFIKQNLSLE